MKKMKGKIRDIGKRIAGFSMTVALIMGLLPLMDVPVYAAPQIPVADITRDQNNDWAGTLTIDESKTVKISGITHDNDNTDYKSAIRICNNATVNLVFEGTNVLKGNSGKESAAGIEVEDGSTLNIYGMDGAGLTVTGGMYGAGIGGIGYISPSTGNKPAGNINIYSGRIIAIGGNAGAGIGSGYHSSASQINIYGGDITALGTGGGAGIGSGYGTTGGAALAAKVGYYKGGRITISGGKVRAASWHMDFEKFDKINPETLYSESYENTFAAGIGGGQGASSGTIVIEGNADVIALGSCGGAGIGTGRGISNVNHYDSDNADCDVTIGGEAHVVSMSTREKRDQVTGKTGGAGIGLGRGWNLEEQPKGKVVIRDNAKVYAYADSGANGIGGSCVVGKFSKDTEENVSYPQNAHLATLSIGDGAEVTAVCGEPNPLRKGFDENFTATLSAAELCFKESFFQNAGIGDKKPFFTDGIYPVTVEARAAGEPDPVTTFALYKKGTISVGVHFPKTLASGAYFRLKDHEMSKGAGILLARGEKNDNWKFGTGSFDVTGLTYEKYSIKYNTNGGTNPSSNPVSYAVYDPAHSLADPFMEGYDFGGWYDNAGLTGNKVTVIPAGSTGDKEFWPKWIKKSGPEPDPTPSPGPTLGGNLLAGMKSSGRDGMIFSWNKIKGAEGYDIFLEKCTGGDETKVSELVKTVKGNSRLTWTKKKLEKNRLYKAVIKAYVTYRGVKTYVKTSPVIHAYTSGGTSKYTNAAGVSVDKIKVSLLPGESHHIKAKVNKLNSGRKLVPSSHVAKLRYFSSNESIATVDDNGKITGKAKGVCTVYAFTANGMSKAIKVIVTPTTTRLTLSRTNVSLQQKGSKATVTVTAFPDKKVTGESIIISKNTDKKVVSASIKNGKLTIKALKKGTASITVKAGTIRKVIRVRVRK
ncbi:MAG: InlB B-repeat-containing protein [Lachnospiraceae bacterium]|nr:InlB B-repeat-containing protein [Lachnospiraceae bacterium]